MDDLVLLRYSRHILLPELGIEAQERFHKAHALIIGAGGLGAPAAQFLVAAGVGTVTLCDADVVDLTNLQRQILYATSDIGAPKVDAASARLSAINPEVRVQTVQARVAADQIQELVAYADVVLDCSDNFATRHAVNRACVAAKKPLVSGAAIRFDGQVAVFDSRAPSSPCYHCLFGESEQQEEMRCAIMGVFAPLVGIIGATQAAEALKIIAGVGESLAGRLLLLDALAMRWREVNDSARSGVRRLRARMKACLRTMHRYAAALIAMLLLSTLSLRADAAAPHSLGSSLRKSEWLSIRNVISEQLKALKAGDAAKAMSFAAPEIRSQFGTPQNFITMVRNGYTPLLAARYTEFLEGAVVDGVVVQPLRLIAPDNSVLVALYTMEKQKDGLWKITGCALAPSDVEAA